MASNGSVRWEELSLNPESTNLWSIDEAMCIFQSLLFTTFPMGLGGLNQNQSGSIPRPSDDQTWVEHLKAGRGNHSDEHITWKWTTTCW